MAKKRVSWELIVGSAYLYFDTRKQAVKQAREEKAQGYPVELRRWEWVSDGEPTSTQVDSTQVDLDALIAAAELKERHVVDAPIAPLPAHVWQDVARALAME